MREQLATAAGRLFLGRALGFTFFGGRFFLNCFFLFGHIFSSLVNRFGGIISPPAAPHYAYRPEDCKR